MKTLIPVAWARVGHGIPVVCARHGRSQSRRRGLTVESPPAGWTYAVLAAGLVLGLGIGGILFVTMRMVTRKTVDLPAWPLCTRCRALHAGWLLAAMTATIPGAALMIYSTASELNRRESNLYAAAGILIISVGLVLLWFLSRARVAKARLSRDGGWIEVRNAAPSFDAQVQATLAEARPSAQPMTSTSAASGTWNQPR